MLKCECAALLMVAIAVQLPGQQAQGAVSVVGGSATDVVGVTSRAVTLTPSVWWMPDPRIRFGIDVAGTKYDNNQWSLGGGAATAARIPVNRFAAVTVDAAAGATGTSYDFSYQTANVLPALELSVGPVTGYVGAHATHASTRSVRVTQGPTGPFGITPPGSRSVVDASRNAHSVLFGATARVASGAGETMLVGVRQEQGDADTVPTVDRSASLSVSSGRVTIGGTAGMRNEREVRAAFGSGAISLSVSPLVAVELNAGSYPANRLVGTPGGRFMNLGLSVRTGRMGRAAPTAEGIPAPAAGMTRLAVRDDGAQRVDVLGDFTNWKPIAAARASNGVWFIDLRIPPGQYRYAFRVNGTTWRVPDGATAADDDFGGKSAWLTVKSAPSSTTR